MSGSGAWVGYLLLLVTVVGWAGAWLTARLAAHDLPPLTVTLGRFVVAAAALLPVWWRRERGARIRLGRGDWLLVLGMSLTGIVTYNVLFMLGVRYAPASDGAVITPGLAGVFSVLLSIQLGSRPPKRALAGALLAALGTLLVGWSAVRTAGAGSERTTGDLFFVGGAAVWAAYTVMGKRLSARLPAISGILLFSLIGVVILVPVVLAVDGVPHPLAWSGPAVLNVAYLGLGATAISFVTYYLAVERIGIERVAPGLGLVPLFGVLGAAVLLDERLVPLHALGGTLVIAGIVLPALRGSTGSAPVDSSR